MDEELIKELDAAIDVSIDKFRKAITGEEVKMFIAEYEELMLKKSKVIAAECLKIKEVAELPPVDDTKYADCVEAKKSSRQALYLSLAALMLSVIAAIVRLHM